MTADAQRAFSGGIIAPGMYSRSDIPKFETGLKDGVNVILRAQGGFANRAGLELAGGFDNSTVDGHPWLVPFEFSADDSYQLEFADEVMRVLKQGEYVLTGDVRAVVDLTAADPGRIEMSSSAHAAEFPAGTLLYLTDSDGDSVFDRTVVKSTGVTDEFVSFEIIDGATVDGTDAGWGTFGPSATAQPVFQLTVPYAIEDLPDLYVVQDVDTLFMVCPGYAPRSLVRGNSDDTWSLTTLTFEPSVPPPTGFTATANGAAASPTVARTYVVTTVSVDGEESLPSSEASADADITIDGRTNDLSWTAVADAEVYNVYKEFNGIFGFIGVAGETTFVDDNITPDTADNPPTGRDPFAGAGNDPSVVAFIENRLTFAATDNNPQAAELSSSVNPFNFNRALTPAGSDAVSFRMRSRQLNRIQHIVPLEFPVILTAGAEWVMTTREEAQIEPANFRLRPFAYRGSSKVQPVVIGETLIHVLRDGNTLREFSLRDDRANASADVTLLARHLFRGKTVVSMAYAQSPDSVVWVVFSDGSCLSMTYIEEHEVWGWTRHVFGGPDAKVKQVSTVREGAYDTAYFVVERAPGGSPITTVERLDNRVWTEVEKAYFVDSGLRFNGGTGTTLSGFLHMRGENVAVLSDGNVLSGFSVDAYGRVELPVPATDVAVGYSYTSSVTTLPVDFGDNIEGKGSALGDFRSASEVAMQVVETRGVAVGREDGWLNEIKQFTGDSPIPLETGTIVIPIEGDWERDASLVVEQVHPLPMEVTSIVPEWALAN